MENCSWHPGESCDGKHYTVLIREKGKLLGRLTPDWATTNRKIHAAVLTHRQALDAAEKINTPGNGQMISGLTAKVARF